MSRMIFVVMAGVVYAALETLSLATPALARGGGSNILNSPGYQRRLQESRGQISTPTASEPYLKPPTVYPGRKWRTRGRR